MSFDHRKYPEYHPISLPDRTWPDQRLTQAPRWCSVDLRDGNQALIDPMTPAEKQLMFERLLTCGFKEIEVGFPAASQPDFDFVRQLIEQNHIPDDVTIQVLTQSRPALIARSFESLRGTKKAIMHFYNSTSTVQREQVFALDKEGIKKIATDGARYVKECAEKQPETDWTFQYSPESFTGTEPEYAVEVCNAVIDVLQPTPAKPCIINLPATVEMNTPNVYADQIEYFCRHVNHRDSVIVSLHTHNDRGCGVAASELGVMAGADRVEGTLLGNGERTGNMDIVTMAMNLYSRGVDPKLNFEDMAGVVDTVERCTKLAVHPRHAYVGELVYTAFSGSHQDAINKCLKRRDGDDEPWNVAYLPIDPVDIGRDYEAVIRINSQSGKGGVAYILESQYGVAVPKWLQPEVSALIQGEAEARGKELNGDAIWQLFEQRYLSSGKLKLQKFKVSNNDNCDELKATLARGDEVVKLKATGSGSIEAFTRALNNELGTAYEVTQYNEHALRRGSDSRAAAFVQLQGNGIKLSGVAIDRDVLSASLQAIVAAVNSQRGQ